MGRDPRAVPTCRLRRPRRWDRVAAEAAASILAVNVSYADINKTPVLVEMAREEAGHPPEVAYGTHFFQDLLRMKSCTCRS